MTLLRLSARPTCCRFGILFAMAGVLGLMGCSSDDSTNGPSQPDPGACAQVGGTWAMALAVDDSWLGPVLSSVAELVQTEDCGITGTMALGPTIAGHVTPDSLYFSYGMPGVPPAERVSCFLEIIDEHLMRGTYVAVEGTGDLTLYGTDPDCSGAVDLQVSAGLVPTITWQPACAASLLVIERVNSGADQWLVGNEDANDLAPVLRYGVAPAGVAASAVVPLEEGVVYEAYLYRWRGADAGYLMTGYGIFTP